MEWQPIETAPKDGTWIITYRPRGEIPGYMDRVVIARWLWTAHRVEMTNFLQVMAAKLCSAGIHKMPGVEVKHERRPV